MVFRSVLAEGAVMYVCKNCSREFEEPEHIVEREIIDYGIGKQWVTLFEGDVCPYCESMHIEEAQEADEDE